MTKKIKYTYAYVCTRTQIYTYINVHTYTYTVTNRNQEKKSQLINKQYTLINLLINPLIFSIKYMLRRLIAIYRDEFLRILVLGLTDYITTYSINFWDHKYEISLNGRIVYFTP